MSLTMGFPSAISSRASKNDRGSNMTRSSMHRISWLNRQPSRSSLRNASTSGMRRYGAVRYDTNFSASSCVRLSEKLLTVGLCSTSSSVMRPLDSPSMNRAGLVICPVWGSDTSA